MIADSAPEYPERMTRDMILEAASREIERNGMTQFRIKRVASDAQVSVALLYSYFDDREDLIACAIVHRFRQVLLGLAETFTRPFRDVSTTDDLRQAIADCRRDVDAFIALENSRLDSRPDSMAIAQRLNLLAVTDSAAIEAWAVIR